MLGLLSVCQATNCDSSRLTVSRWRNESLYCSYAYIIYIPLNSVIIDNSVNCLEAEEWYCGRKHADRMEYYASTHDVLGHATTPQRVCLAPVIRACFWHMYFWFSLNQLVVGLNTIITPSRHTHLITSDELMENKIYMKGVVWEGEK